MATLAEGRKAIRRLIDRLEASGGLSEAYAKALLRQAIGRAQGQPTPQAVIASQAMVVRHGEILSLTGGTPGALAVGSEFGSTIYRQFGPRNTRGYWLLPSADNPDTVTTLAGDNWVQDAVDSAIRGF
jgi:hypothetical protein